MNTPIRRSPTHRSHTGRSLAVVTLALATAGLAACGGSSSVTKTAPSAAAVVPSAAAAAAAKASDPNTANLVGPGCDAYAAQVPTGPGSVDGMAQDPVAVAAGNNPLLTKLTAAVSGQLNKQVNLTQTLNGGDFTIFAPVNSAFAKMPAGKVASLKMSRNSTALRNILTYHVVAEQLNPEQVVGTQKTVEGGDLTVTRSGTALKVNGANVICGGVKTANATVYLIDSVLTPPTK